MNMPCIDLHYFTTDFIKIDVYLLSKSWNANAEENQISFPGIGDALWCIRIV